MVLNSLYEITRNDKFMHFIYGIAIYALLVPFGAFLAIALTTVIAWWKEHNDKKGYGTYEVKDALYTSAGAVFLFAWYGVISYAQSIF